MFQTIRKNPVNNFAIDKSLQFWCPLKKADFPTGILKFGSLCLEIGQKDERTRLRGIGESLNITERKL
jgi:hypothetical protein